MTAKPFILQLAIFLLVGQLVALAANFFWKEHIFIPMIFGSLGAMIGGWFQQRKKEKSSGT